ncbi:MAG TPA: hypothetical protein VGM54_10165 [Chthoniobacter sp.]|jgi:hypothetical protein
MKDLFAFSVLVVAAAAQVFLARMAVRCLVRFAQFTFRSQKNCPRRL